MSRRGLVPTLVAVAGLCLALTLSACATFEEVTALGRVDFSLGGVSEGTLAGVSIESVRDPDRLDAVSLARVAAALSSGELPLEAVFEVRGDNPADNPRARLLALDWTLFLDDRETVSGSFEEEYLLPSGESTTIPLRVEIDLLDFFENRLEQVVDLALAVAGEGDPRRVYFEATPTVRTPIGPIRYPEPVRIEPLGGS